MAFEIKIDMQLQCCITCGIAFAVPTEVEAQRRRQFINLEDGDDDDELWLHCPNGHRYGWPKPEPKSPSEQDDRLRELHTQDQLDAAREEVAEARKEIESLRSQIAAASPTTSPPTGKRRGRPRKNEAVHTDVAKGGEK